MENGATGKVSCLMVTTAARLAFARRAIDCFHAQSYPDKELVIVSRDDVSSLGLPFHHAPPISLGDLRNYGIARALGDFIAVWDDDDWHHPDRLAAQLATLASSPEDDACTLTRVVLAWPSRSRYAIMRERKLGLEGTIVARRWNMPCYPALPAHEDSQLLPNLDVVTLDEPMLYAYVVHDGNTSTQSMFEGLFDETTPLGSEDVALVRIRLGIPP